MVFLKSSFGKYEFVDAEYASLPLPRERISGVPPAPQDNIYLQVVSRLAESLFDRDLFVQERIVRLSDLPISDDHTPYLTEVLESALDSSAGADPDFRSNLIAALVLRNDRAALPKLRQALFSSAGGVISRGNLIFALQFVDSKTAVPILAQALTLPDAELREDAAQALQNAGKNASQEAINALLAALDDPDREAQSYVMQFGFSQSRTVLAPALFKSE